MSDIQVSAFRKHWRVSAYCFIASFAATALGFDQGTVGGFLAMQQWLKDFGYYDTTAGEYSISAGDTTALWGITVGFAFLASASCGYLGTRFGRKGGLIFCAVSGLLGSGLQMIPHYAVMLVGKAFMGMSVGFAGNFSITYWSEVAPAKIRGMIVILYQMNINIPNFIGACVDQGTHAWMNRWSYWTPLLVTMFPPLVLLIFVWLMPESPRWLVTRDRIDEARASIQKLRGEHTSHKELDQEINECILFTELEKTLETSTSFIECFRGIDARRTFIGALLMGGQHLMGIGFISVYSTYFFNLIGFTDAFVITVIINACQVVGPFVAVALVRFVGRRTILIIGAGVCSFSMLAYATIAEAAPGSSGAGKSVIAFICIYVFSFSVSWGSIGPVVTGEVPSNRLRSKTVSIALSTNLFLDLVVVTGVPYLINAQYGNLGTRVGFIFGGLGVVVFILTILYVPETKDRSLEEIDEMFLNRVPTRKFKTYSCTKLAAGYDISGVAGKALLIETEVERTEKPEVGGEKTE